MPPQVTVEIPRSTILFIIKGHACHNRTKGYSGINPLSVELPTDWVQVQNPGPAVESRWESD